MFALSFVWAVAIAMILGGIALVRTRETKRAGLLAAVAFGLQLVLGYGMMYLVMPALTGTFFGMTPFLILSTIVAGVVAGIAAFQDDRASNRYDRHSRYDRDSRAEQVQPRTMGSWLFLVAGGLVTLMVVGWVGTYGFVTWSTENARTNAAFAHVRTAGAEEKLPKTDPDHMVQVTRSIASYLGQQALASTGDNLGSIYMTQEQDYVLQSIKGHLYWVAPLLYSRTWNQMGFGLDDLGARGGFVAVDAEDPNGEVKIHQEHILHFVPSNYFGKNLERHVYESGYMYGSLDDPTLEVDDNWKPYFTITYTAPQRVVRGNVIKKVLVVDATTGAIEAFDQDKQPDWIDRVMFKDLVSEYLDQWGKWSDPRSLNDWPQLFTAKFMVQPVEFELLYNSADKPVWLVPMTSRNATDLSCTGVILYDSNKNEAVYYPGLAGIGIGKNVIDAFEHSPRNLKGYKIDHLQLYSINGEPTWVGIYVQSAGEHGRTFAAIGMLDARHVQGANVVMAQDKRSALAQYASYLAGASVGNGGHVATGGQPSKVVSGKVYRIGWTVVDGQTVYTMQIEGDQHTFTVTLKVAPKLPLVREGDFVKITYLDTGEETESVMELVDAQLHGSPQKVTPSPVESGK